MFKTALLFSVLGLFSAPQVEIRQIHAGPWRIERMRDRFTGDISCRVRLGRMRVEGPALIIDLGRDVQTSAAVYRVDSGAAVRAETDPFNAQYQTRMSAAAPLDNPSAGRIAIAVSTLKSARTVWIRPTPSASPRPFDISGLDSATTAAAAAGCP